MQGVITQHPTGTEDYSIRGKFKVPINFHVGSLGLAQATNTTVDSVVPMMGGRPTVLKEMKKENSMPVGMGYRRTWIDQWRPGP